MKKTFLLFTLIICSMGLSYAQAPKGFEKSIETGIYVEMDENPVVSINGSFIAGYRFNPFVFVGGGAGLDISVWDDYNSLLMPIFARGKFNFTKTKVSPFAFIDTGYNILVASNVESGYRPYVREGVFIGTGVGVDFNRQNGKAISLTMGFRSHTNESSYSNYNIESFGFRVCFRF